jgi:hypothetical protein
MPEAGIDPDPAIVRARVRSRWPNFDEALMKRTLLACVLLAAIGNLPLAMASPPFHARGNFYAGTAGLWGADEGNRLFDDGLHDDGAAGDGVWAGTVIADQPPGDWQFRIASADWSENWPFNPSCPLCPARLHVSSVGESIHFRLDRRTLTGWQPESCAVACDHGTPEGMVLELCGSAPEAGAWVNGVASVLDGGVWRTEVAIAQPGTCQFKFRGAGAWDWAFGTAYNMGTLDDNFTVITVGQDDAVKFEFNTLDGRGRAWVYDPTPVRTGTWGGLKARYR